ncbi:MULTISPECIES: hypothetical protein [unclassified Microcoleus]|uniref:hypothetical protein n=1 Tax=unclassified Microcoleus TaxID=2642155 RepID=UPI002FD356CD
MSPKFSRKSPARKIIAQIPKKPATLATLTTPRTLTTKDFYEATCSAPTQDDNK